MTFTTLDQFEAEIARLAASGTELDAADLMDLSVQLRRMLWNNRELARLIAASADRAASEIFGRPVAPLPRFPATYSDCSGWSQRID